MANGALNANMTLMIIALFICAGLLVYLNVEGFDATGSTSASASGSASGSAVIAAPTLSREDILQLLRSEVQTIISKSPVKVDSNEIYAQLKPKIQELIHNTPLKIDPLEFINTVKPDLIKIIKESMPKPVAAYAAPVAQAAVRSPALDQGIEYATAAPGCKPFNINEWIRKDSIPCYGCTLPA
jgi:hypothetical protein